ncbi:MAG: amidohydrolase [Myxococcota bacterium]
MKNPGRTLRHTGLALVFSMSAAEIRAEPLVLQGATLFPVAQGPIENGVLVIEGGRIQAIGAEGEVRIPRGASVRDVSGLAILPGLVDTHSHIGLYARPLVAANRDGNETTDPVTPEMRALDAIWPADPAIRMARAGGITTANIMPGSGNVVGGQTAYLKLRGETVEAMRIRDPQGRPVRGGMKMANGENPKRAHDGLEASPATRMGVAFLERKVFVDAEGYGEKWRRYEKRREGDPPARDLGLEPMLEVLSGDRVVHHHTHRADDILTVLRIQEEFGHRVVLQHATEAYLVADEIAARGVSVSAIVVDSPGGKHEAMNLGFENPGLLEAAGVPVALHTDDLITSSRLFLRSAALAVRGGMSESGALRAVTLEAARMLDLDDRLGSLEPGKDADFVLLSGPPFSVRTRVLETWIDGVKVFDVSDPADLRHQTGGFQVMERYPELSGAAP